MSDTPINPVAMQTVPDVAAEFGVVESTIWRWIKKGELVAVKIGPATTRIAPDDKASFLAKRRAESAAA
jgi:predicted site-specific integrase-resolvase